VPVSDKQLLNRLSTVLREHTIDQTVDLTFAFGDGAEFHGHGEAVAET